MASLLRRNGTWYLQWSVNGRVRRRSLRTRSKQLAREKLRQFESAVFRGDEPPTPTRTPIPDAVDRYVAYIRGVKTAKSAQADVYVLRDIFGPCCDALRNTSRHPRRPRTRPRSRRRLRAKPTHSSRFALVTDPHRAEPRMSIRGVDRDEGFGFARGVRRSRRVRVPMRLRLIHPKRFSDPIATSRRIGRGVLR